MRKFEVAQRRARLACRHQLAPAQHDGCEGNEFIMAAEVDRLEG